MSKILALVFVALLWVSVLSVFLFFMAFLLGGMSKAEDIPVCDRIDTNIERLWPIRAGCWFWKPYDEK